MKYPHYMVSAKKLSNLAFLVAGTLCIVFISCMGLPPVPEGIVATMLDLGYSREEALLSMARQMAQYESVRKSGIYWTMILEGTLHLDFTDNDYLASALPFIPELLEDRGELPRGWARRIVRESLDAFFRAYVLGEKTPGFDPASMEGVIFEGKS